jgi:hypothetical protein
VYEDTAEVTDLGLRLADVPELDRELREAGYAAGFTGEDATRSKRLPATILDYLTPAEHELLTGTRLNQKVWEYRRGDAVKAAIIEQFSERYDLDALPAFGPVDLESHPALYWRDALDRHIDPRGDELAEEMEAAVRGYLALQDEE